MMGHIKLKEPPLHFVEGSFIFHAEDDGVCSGGQASGRGLARRVDKLCGKHASREIFADDAEVGEMGGLNGNRTRGLLGAYPRRSTC